MITRSKANTNVYVQRMKLGGFLFSLVCVFICLFLCPIATGHTNEATIMKFGMKGRWVKF